MSAFLAFFCQSVNRLQTAIGIGARPQAATHKTQSAPQIETTATFDCEQWPACGCPGGTMRPECPGLAKIRKTKPDPR